MKWKRWWKLRSRFRFSHSAWMSSSAHGRHWSGERSSGIGFCAKSLKREKSCMNELTKEWVDKAEADFYSADLLLHAGEYPLPEPACFHCSSVRKNISRLIFKNTKLTLNVSIVL